MGTKLTHSKKQKDLANLIINHLKTLQLPDYDTSWAKIKDELIFEAYSGDKVDSSVSITIKLH